MVEKLELTTVRHAPQLEVCPFCGLAMDRPDPELSQHLPTCYFTVSSNTPSLMQRQHAWNRRAPVSTPQQSAQRASVDRPTDEQISAIYRSTFPRGPYLVTPDVHKFARAILAWGSAGSGAIPDLYTCKGKGGKYAFLGVAKGAGNAKLIINLAVYRDVASGQLYFRDPTEFDSRMEKIAAPSPAPQGEQA